MAGAVIRNWLESPPLPPPWGPQNFYGEMQPSWAIEVTSDTSGHMMMMMTNPVRPAPNPTYSSYFHPIWMIWKIRNMVGTHWELKGNTVGTHIVNQGKMRKIPHPTPSPPKTSKEKIQATLVASWAFPLAAWNFSSQKSSSLFLAWANYPFATNTLPYL